MASEQRQARIKELQTHIVNTAEEAAKLAAKYNRVDDQQQHVVNLQLHQLSFKCAMLNAQLNAESILFLQEALTQQSEFSQANVELLTNNQKAIASLAEAVQDVITMVKK